MSPSQMLAVFVSLCLISALIAVPFALLGASAVLMFAGLELAAVAAAMLVHARHVNDRDVLTLSGGFLRVERTRGSRTERTDFRTEWLAVEPSRDDRSLIELSGQGRRVAVGRFVPPPLRPQLAQDLRLALRSARAGSPSAHSV
jgi:uncharacterized membrane protein